MKSGSSSARKPDHGRWTAVLLSAALLLSLVGLPLTAPARADAEGEGATPRLDGLAAVVGGLAPGPGVISILRSDVELRARMAILREREVEVALGPVPDNVLRASLSELLGEALIAAEAARLNLEPPSGLALADQRARLLGQGERAVATRALLRALGVSARELSAWVERRAVVNGFLEANLEGTLEASSSELERLFKSERHPYRDLPFDEARTPFAAWLAQQRMEQAVQRWVQSLTERTPHRILVAY
ncbi:MAG: hypothetical protein JWN48_3271 [Myxococcaceae bacterium]|nr:hypothetical protein [Myxococcaceae bacterium]